jgi:hypothetical protein
MRGIDRSSKFGICQPGLRIGTLTAPRSPSQLLDENAIVAAIGRDCGDNLAD